MDGTCIATTTEALRRTERAFRPRHTLCEFLCRPWSQSTNRSDPGELEQRRQAERPMLYWFATVLFPEILTDGNNFIVEDPWRSYIWTDSPLKELDALIHSFHGTPHDNTTGQCRHGARDDEQDRPIRKRTIFKSAARLRDTSKRCDCVTQHANLQMNDSKGFKRTAKAARYPQRLCKALVRDMVRHLHQAPQLT